MPQDRAQRPDPAAPPPPGDARSSAQVDVGRILPAAGSGPELPSSAGTTTKGTYFLGRYRVVDEIGIGGMASVHLARMDGPGGFQKWVAIKRIHPHLIEDDSFVHMFLDEARIAARISHPNVATVFELGKHDDTYWIAMEYLHGEPLREVMRRTEEVGAPMPPEIACRVIADAAEGLHAAHELLGKNGEKLNLIHRDVTPHNLFVTYEGSTKVVDFGIAKFSSRMSSTRAGTLKGKLAYMSPEQVQGETIDRRTDIFALGVVLWELTTGQRLFRMESDLDTLAKVQECNIPRPSTIVRGYPIDLEKIVMKALAKNRGERFKTAREFSRMLQSLLMRRGLFVASDEVANYIQGLFKDRIEKREAHLRWAGEVTQTINLESLQAEAAAKANASGGASGGASAARSDRSDVQASGGPQRLPPRPAAGVPASAPRPATAKAPGAPPPSAGLGPMAKTVPALSDPPAMASRGYDDDEDDAPTLQATVAQVMAARAPGGAAPYGGGSGFDEDFEDVNDTIVERSPVQEDEPPARPMLAPLPAAGRPAAGLVAGPAPRAAPHSDLARTSPEPRTLPMNTMSPAGARRFYDALASSKGPGGEERPPRSNLSIPTPLVTDISDPSLPNTLALPMGMGPLPTPPAAQPPELPPAPVPPFGRQAGSHQAYPTMPRMAALPSGDRAAQTAQYAAQRPGNRAPWWAVAILAATAVFLVTGIVYGIVTFFSSPSGSAQKTVAQAPSEPSPAPEVASVAPKPSVASGSGPFVAARAGFLAAIEPPTPAAPTTPPAPPATATEATAAPTDQAPSPAAEADSTAPAPPATAAPPPPAPPPAPVEPAPKPAPPPVAVVPVTPAPRRVPSGAAPAPAPAFASGMGLLSVICLPACDQIYDNGKYLGPSPIFKKAATVGSHKVKLVLNEPSVIKTISVIVQADQVSMVRESMP